MDYSNMKAKQVSKKKIYSYEKEQPRKKQYSYEKEQPRKKQYSYEKDIQKTTRALNKSAISWVVVVLFLIAGVIGGFFAHKYAFANDTYYMIAYSNGQTDITIGKDENFQEYTELGVKCISFGKDYSSECTVKYYYRSDLTEKQIEVSEVDETKAGIYYAVYSNNSKKFKTVTLIRNIIVLSEEA